MSRRSCVECGQQNPLQARFCMSCGLRLPSSTAAATIAARSPGTLPGGAGWSGAAAALIALCGLWHISRKARQTAIVMLFLVLFFGLPMFCGFATFALEWLGRLLH